MSEVDVAERLAAISVTLTSSEWAAVVAGLRFLAVHGSTIHGEPSVKITSQVEAVYQQIANEAAQHG